MTTGNRNLFMKTYSRKYPANVWNEDKFVTGLQIRTPTQASVKQPRFLKNRRIYPEVWPRQQSDDERFISLTQRKTRPIHPLRNISNVNKKDGSTLRIAGKRIGSPFHRKKPLMSHSRGNLELIEESELDETEDIVEGKLMDISSKNANFRTVQCTDARQLLPVTATPAVSESSTPGLSDEDNHQLSETSSITDSMETIADDLPTSDIDTSSTLSIPEECILEVSETADEDATLTDSTMTTMKVAFAEDSFPDMETLRHDLPQSDEIARPLEPVQFSFLNPMSKPLVGKTKGLLPLIKVSKVTPRKRPLVSKFTSMNRVLNSTLQKDTGLCIHDYQSIGDISDIPVDNDLVGQWNACADQNLNSTPVLNGISQSKIQLDVSSIQGSFNHMDNFKEVVTDIDIASTHEAKGDKMTQECALPIAPATKHPRSVYSFTTSEESLGSVSVQQFTDANSLQIHGKKLMAPNTSANKNSAISKQTVQFIKSKSFNDSSNASKQVSFSLSANEEKVYQPELSIKSAQLHLPSISPSSSILKKRNVSFVDKAVGNDCTNKQTSTPIKRKNHKGRRSLMKYSFDVDDVALPACDESELIVQDRKYTVEETPTKVNDALEVIRKSVSPHNLSYGNNIDKDLQKLMIRGERTPSMRVKRASNSVVPNLPKNKKSRKMPGLNDSIENQPLVKQTTNRKRLFKNEPVVPQCSIECFDQYSCLPGKVIQYKSPIKYDPNIPTDILTTMTGTVSG